MDRHRPGGDAELSAGDIAHRFGCYKCAAPPGDSEPGGAVSFPGGRAGLRNALNHLDGLVHATASSGATRDCRKLVATARSRTRPMRSPSTAARS